MKVVSFNVNGLRSFAKKQAVSFGAFISNNLGADILCVQETKGSPGTLAGFHSLDDYFTFSSFFSRKGRHGVSTFVRKSIDCLKSVEIIPGRVIKTVHEGFTIYNCYLPYWDEDEEKDKTEIIECYKKLGSILKACNKKTNDASNDNMEPENIIVCGDFNACYSIMDHYMYLKEFQELVSGLTEWTKKPAVNLKTNSRIKDRDLLFLEKENIRKGKIERPRQSSRLLPYIFFTIQELENYFYKVFQREWLYDFTESYVDTFRVHNSQLEAYTCWNTVLNNRPANLGTRIDYVFCSESLKSTGAGIVPEIEGSDHCPVWADFEIQGGANWKERVNKTEGGVDETQGGKSAPMKRKNNILEYFKKR